jgi:hypothetical protein
MCWARSANLLGSTMGGWYSVPIQPVECLVAWKKRKKGGEGLAAGSDDVHDEGRSKAE